MPEDFIWHGLRHIVITKFRQLKIDGDIARLITDHAGEPEDEHSGYEHHDPREEMSEALEKWCAYLQTLVASAGKVS